MINSYKSQNLKGKDIKCVITSDIWVEFYDLKVSMVSYTMIILYHSKMSVLSSLNNIGKIFIYILYLFINVILIMYVHKEI